MRIKIPQTNSELISLFVSLASASLKISKIILHEPKRDVIIRGQINLFLSAPFGETKSTILKEIAAFHKTRVITKITAPALVGTVDSRTSQYIPASAWCCRNNFVLIDEFHLDNNELLIDALLQIIEGGEYSKDIAKTCADFCEADGELFCKSEKGKLSLKTRISAIITSMYDVGGKQSILLKALLSRCIPIRYCLEYSEIQKIGAGEKLYLPHSELLSIIRKGNKLKGGIEAVEIQEVDYMKILNFVHKFVTEKNKLYEKQCVSSNGAHYTSNDGKSLYLRSVGDCCRIFVILQEHDEILYDLICTLKATGGYWATTLNLRNPP